MTAQSESSREPAIRAFAIALGAFRDKAGMSKKELAEKLGYTPAYVSQIEAAKNVPSAKFAEDLNTLFGTEAFAGLWQNIVDARSSALLPPGFADYVEREACASLIYTFEFSVIKGIFQTHDYAREVLQSGRTMEETEQLVSKRMERKSVISREGAPQIVAVFDEVAIRRVIGSREIMKAQVGHLIEVAEMPNVLLQVVDADQGAYPGINGSFTIMEFDEASAVVYVEGHAGGTLTDNSVAVREHRLSFNLIRAAAMPADESLKLLRTVWESL
ncbi:helix-turn-helix transcriptional regulator [Actinocorallia sp. B10E7]|uniref:helix-turn-helix domain-containing protein n=1 Tax=Actinocorallia sp. B10E7 TaxID=3153558 RepID=UPI00325DDF88